jgi:nitrate/TMAO reductase-like tetraheme cytochrome c subunit
MPDRSGYECCRRAFCHSNDYRNAKSVDHVAAGFSMECRQCHGFDDWIRAFDHTELTGFALVGAHSRLDCAQCHVNGKFSGVPSECIGCHLQNYRTTNNPNHVSGGFPQDCTLCHSTAAWTPAVFDHSKTQFALTGGMEGCSARRVTAAGSMRVYPRLARLAIWEISTAQPIPTM